MAVSDGHIAVSCAGTQSERYYQMKLLLVGGPNKGKTSLLECLIMSRPLKAPLATLGVSIRDWRCVL